MDHRRYRAYRRVCDLLDSSEAAAVGDDERELIRDMAEAMLLTRSADADDLEEVSNSACAALKDLTARGDLSRPAASDLWEGICMAGPEPRVAVPAGEAGAV